MLRLLEDVGLPELVIQLASLAITEAVNDVNSQVSSFLSSMFLRSEDVACTRGLRGAAVFRLLCGPEYSSTTWTSDTTVKLMKPSHRTRTAACTYRSF